ncbi:MAG: HDOD domain-containing protein [Deltaproteobacteria bacterium]|nr:HDOD domain-containing protein [Deltaproteobacteria bacterium]
MKDIETRKQRAIRTTLKLMAAHRDTGNFESLPWPRNIIDRETKRIKLDLRNGDVDVDYLERVVRRSFRWNPQSVPMIPDDKLQLLRLLRTNASMSTLENHIRNGSELESQIIETANSQLFKGHSPVSSIRNAMVRLGMESLKFLIYQIVISKTLYRSKQFEGLVRKLQFKAIASAHFAREIASWINYQSDEAYLAALVHDIGEPYILQLMDVLQLDMEEELAIGILKHAHSETGATILKRINVPLQIINAAESHHDFAGQGLQTTSVLCAAADQICFHLNLLDEKYWNISVSRLPFRLLGISNEDAEIIIERCQDILDGLLE